MGIRPQAAQSQDLGMPSGSVELQKVGQQLALEAKPLYANGLQLPSSGNMDIGGWQPMTMESQSWITEGF